MYFAIHVINFCISQIIRNLLYLFLIYIYIYEQVITTTDALLI